MKRHHNSQPRKVPIYEKYPLEQRFIEVDPSYDSDGEGYNICGKNWDTGLPASGKPYDGSGNDLELGGWNRGTYYTRRVGEYEWCLENWRMVYHPDRNYARYRVDQATLDFSGIPMTESDSAYKNGCYAYAGRATGRYMKGLGVFPMDMKDTYNKNKFVKNKYMGNYDVGSDGKVFTNPNAVSYWFEPQSNRILTISRKSATSKFAAYRMYTGVFDNNDVTDTVEITDPSTLSFTYRTYTVSLCILIVVSDDGTSVEDLQDIIQIEEGDVATEYVPPKDMTKVSGWSMPYKEDFQQLFGMCGNNMTLPNIFAHCCVAPDDEVPWVDSWDNQELCKDFLGVRLQPCGHKGNAYYTETGDNAEGWIHNFGKRLSLSTYDDPQPPSATDAPPAVWVTQTERVHPDMRVSYDIANATIPVPASMQYWLRSIRFCRRLTDEELGYKLWVDSTNDRILVTSLSDPQPSGTVELEKGTLRGLACRWFDNQQNPTAVTIPLSYLQGEVAKTANGGGYNWYGWV